MESDSRDLRRQVLEACHDSIFSGHFGGKRTSQLCNRVFYWPGMDKDIEAYCAQCPICQAVKPTNHKPFGMIRPLPVPAGKWTDVSVDMVVALPTTKNGFDSILVFVDRLTKMVHLVPTTETLDSPGFCELFAANVVKLHGCPMSLLSDRGSIFASKFTRCFASNLACWQRFGTAFHPQSEGQTERFNRVMEDVIRCYVSTSQDDWDTLLPMVEFAMNNAPSSATKQSAFMLNYGVNPRHPSIAKLVRLYSLHGVSSLSHRIRQAQFMGMVATASAIRTPIANVPTASKFAKDMQRVVDHTKLWLNNARQRMIQQEQHNRKPDPFKPGQFVWLSLQNIKMQNGGGNKLMPRYIGPFKITEQIGKVSYRLDLPPTMRVHNVFHASLLKAWKHRPGESLHPSPIIVDEQEEWVVERLEDRRIKTYATRKKKHTVDKIRHTRVEYLVKWEGFDLSYNEWITESELRRHCNDMVDAFDRRFPRP
jgi:Integrase zinc binding domain/Chromo (CHRromatin Organisation MOdifier) domain